MGKKEEVKKDFETEELFQDKKLVDELDLSFDAVTTGLGVGAETGEVLLLDAVDPRAADDEEENTEEGLQKGLLEEQLDWLGHVRRSLWRKERRS